ncbi:MAG: NAD(P)H-dependent flavin oxidoreductase [Bacilli bacterium]
MRTKLTETFGIQLPIVQGGLAYLADSTLCAAVSEAGGLGQLTVMTIPTVAALKEEITACFTQTKNPFALNFVLSERHDAWQSYLDVALEMGVRTFSITGGNPKPFFERLQGVQNCQTLVLVSSVRQAVKARALGATAIICVGQEGGGHIGRSDVGTWPLTRAVGAAVDCPVIASGGLSTGTDLAAALTLGASGIEMGTRFVATTDCVRAHEHYKRAIVEASMEDTIVIKRSIGQPARALRNDWTTHVAQLEQTNIAFSDLFPYISGERNVAYALNGEEGFGWAGQSVEGIHEILSVQALFTQMLEDASDKIARLKQVNE